MDWTDEDSARVQVTRKAILPPQKLAGFFASTDTTFYVQIQINAAFEKEPISEADFRKLIEAAESQSAAIMKSRQVQNSVDHTNATLDQALKGKLGESAEVKMGHSLLLPMTGRSNRHFTMPMLVKFLADVGGKSDELMLVGIINFVRVKEKLLCIYLYDRYVNEVSKQNLLKVSEAYLRSL